MWRAMRSRAATRKASAYWTRVAGRDMARPSSRRPPLHVTGVDIAPEAIEYARANYPIPNLLFAVSSVRGYSFSAEQFRSGGGV